MDTTRKTSSKAVAAIEAQMEQLRREMELLKAADAIRAKWEASSQPELALEQTPSRQAPARVGRANDPDYGEITRLVEEALKTFKAGDVVSIGPVMKKIEEAKPQKEVRQQSVTGVLKKKAANGELKLVRKGKGNLPNVYKKI
jgi:hypothetical protein